MLARTADNLFWLARSMERADFTARTIEATLRLESCPNPARRIWRMGGRPVVGGRARRLPREPRRTRRALGGRIPHFRPRQSVLHLQLPRERPRHRPRGAHRAHRRDLDRDQRRLARAQALRVAAARRPRIDRESLARFLDYVKKASLDFDGSCYRTMLRNDAYWFNRLGIFIERADNTARLLDVKYHLLLP